MAERIRSCRRQHDCPEHRDQRMNPGDFAAHSCFKNTSSGHSSDKRASLYNVTPAATKRFRFLLYGHKYASLKEPAGPRKDELPGRSPCKHGGAEIRESEEFKAFQGFRSPGCRRFFSSHFINPAGTRTHMKAKITGLATHVPPRVLRNSDLEKLVETTNEWILDRTGIAERHIVDKGMATSDLAAEAVKKLLAQGPETRRHRPAHRRHRHSRHVFPFHGVSGAAQDRSHTLWGFDISAACCGFLYALNTARSSFTAAPAKGSWSSAPTSCRASLTTRIAHVRAFRRWRRRCSSRILRGRRRHHRFHG